MNLKYYYWYFQSVIPERICDDIIRYGKEQDKEMALTGNQNKTVKDLSELELKNIQQKRKSDVVWMSDRWIYNEIQPYVNIANEQSGWNFSWDWSESCQFTKYSKGQYYGWHCDSWEKPYEGNNESTGRIRKLSVTVSLSDPSEYEGGELEFDFRNRDPDKKRSTSKCTEILPKGSLVVFPSFMWHRVRPVTKGTRHSLVIWNLGKPFK